MRKISLRETPEEGVSHDPSVVKRVLLRRGDVPALTNLSAARLSPGQRTSPHSHPDMTEVFFVLSGSAVFRVGGAVLRAGEGDCVIVEPGEGHEIENAGPGDLSLLYFGVEG